MSEKDRSKPYMHDDADQYGFDWNTVGGPRVQVTRLATIRGRRVLMVATEHASVQLAISPTGREITMYGDLKVSTRG